MFGKMGLIVCDFIVILSVVFILNDVMALPYIAKSSKNYDSRLTMDYDDNVQNYLMEFGYLPKSNIETGNLRTIEQLRSAIEHLQKFANLPVTGEIDRTTIELMKMPRCGAPDTVEAEEFLTSNDMRSHRRHKRYVIQGQKWDHTTISWSLINQTMEKLSAGQVRRVLHEALDVWAQNSKLTFREVHHSDAADIQVMFAKQYHGDGYKFDGVGGVLAHAFYPGTGVGGDAHFDEEEHWVLGENDEGTRLFDVALHEFGHSLGLGHSSVKNSIMFPWHHVSYRGKHDIPDDDRIGIQSIYGSKHRIYGVNPQRTTQPTTTTTTTTTTPPPTRRYLPDREYYPKKEDTDHPRRRFEESPYNPRVSSTTSTTEAPRRRSERPRYQPAYPRSTEYPEYTTRRVHQERPYPRQPDPTEKPQHEHRPKYSPEHGHHNNHITTRRPYQEKPDPCNTSYDAITIIRNELFIFKDRFLWRFLESDSSPGTAIEIDRMWTGLPNDYTHIDTVYENKHRKIVFFIGRQYYVFNSNYLEPGYPRPLTDLGIPASIEKIDAALIWGHNNRTYLYSGRLYWRFDEDTNHVELDYPRDMSMWKGIGYKIDAALQYRDGKTYFFKGTGFWRFNDYKMSIGHERQKMSAQHWMKCHHTQKEPLKDKSTNTAYRIHQPSWTMAAVTSILLVFKFRFFYY